MINISASLIKDYLSCPAKVGFRMSGDKALSTPSQLAGILVHKVIELYANNKEEAMANLPSMINSFGVHESKHNLIYRCIENFYSSFSNMCKEDDEVEKFFKFKLKEYDSVNIVGMMDRVIKKRIVIDWKTSTRQTTENALSYDPQFILYNWAFKRLYDKEPALFYVQLYDGKMFEYKHNEINERMLFLDIIPKIIKDIPNGLIYSGFYTGSCHSCPYRVACRGDS